MSNPIFPLNFLNSITGSPGLNAENFSKAHQTTESPTLQAIKVTAQPQEGNAHLWPILHVKATQKCSFTICKLRFFRHFFVQPGLITGRLQFVKW